MHKEFSDAFSLIELLIVLAVIAILLALGGYQYSVYRSRAAYSALSSQLQVSRMWAEKIVDDYSRFPNGKCDASSLSSGALKCEYDPDKDDIVVSSGGSLRVNSPLTVSFIRSSKDSSCGIIKVECPKDNCAGLKNSTETSGAVICIDTCEAAEEIKEDTNIHGVINGGCP